MVALDDLLTRDDGLVLTREDGVHLAESYATLRRTSKAIGAAMDALKAPRSVVLTRAKWTALGRTTPSLEERRAVVVAHLVRASATCSIVRLALPGTLLSGLEPGLLATIAGSSALRELDLRNNRMEGGVAARLGAALGACRRLETLVLHGNRLGHGCREVAAGLAGCVELRRLDMGRCEVGRGGMEAIVRSCPGLERLELASNHIGAPGVGGGLPRLEYLDLSHNPLGRAAGHAQGELPALLRGCPRLAHVKLGSCDLCGPALKATLGACTGLQTLDLQRNAMWGDIDMDADMRAVAALLARAPRLAELDLSFCGRFADVELRQLRQALRACAGLQTLKLHGDVHGVREQTWIRTAWQGPADGLQFAAE